MSLSSCYPATSRHCPDQFSLLRLRWVRGVACIRDVGCAHLGFAPCLVRIRCSKVGYVHPSKWPFWVCASVFKKTLACIRFRKQPLRASVFKSLKKSTFGSEHPKLWFLLPEFCKSHRVPFSNPCLWGCIYLTGTIPHATWTLMVSMVRAILCCKNPVVKTMFRMFGSECWVLVTWKRMHARVISETDARNSHFGHQCAQPERSLWRMHATDFWATDARKVWGKSRMHATLLIVAVHTYLKSTSRCPPFKTAGCACVCV